MPQKNAEINEILRLKAIEYTEKEIKNLFGKEREIIELFRFLESFRKVSNILNTKIKESEKIENELIEKVRAEVSRINELKEKFREKLNEEIRIFMPNTVEILGEELAAKFLEHANSLEKLARMPSSTIQVFGAEKALFRHMKGKGTSPKHGLIFSHPYVNSVKKEMRGKAARILAGKLSLAFKMDFYKSSYKAESMKIEIENKIAELMKNEGNIAGNIRA